LNVTTQAPDLLNQQSNIGGLIAGWVSLLCCSGPANSTDGWGLQKE